ncbi:MAG: alpha/beta fold hydrolase [Pseudomonadota bacterium]
MTEQAAGKPEDFTQAYTLAMAHLMQAGIESMRSSDILGAIADTDVEIAETPADIIYQQDKVTVSRYRPLTDVNPNIAPVLIVYGLFGRQTMIDLQEDRSMVRNLLMAGLDVHVLDWGNPTRADQFITLDDLIDIYLRDAVVDLKTRSGMPINLFGICEGGTLCASLAALSPELLSSLALAITPIDFDGDPDNYWQGEGFLNQWLQNMRAEDITDLVDTHGNLPGAFSGAMFSALTPITSMTKYNLGLQALAGNRDKILNFLRMEKWIADRPDHPGAAAKQWFNDLYRENKLMKGAFQVEGQTVDLKKIKCPVLNIYALQDHIVPVSTSKALSTFIPKSRYKEIGFPGGHVGVFVSSKAQGVVAGGLVDWLKSNQKEA